MANSYYSHTTYPVANSQGASSGMRGELNAITAGFDLLPNPLGVGQQGFSGGSWLNPTLPNGGTMNGTFAGAPIFSGLVQTGGSIDGTVIGGTTPAAATVSTLGVTTGGTLAGTFAGTPTFSGLIQTGGSINGTVIGGTTPAAGTFSTLGVTTGGALAGTFTGTPIFSGAVQLTGSPVISGGTIDGSIIGGTTPKPGTFQTLGVTTGGALAGTFTGTPVFSGAVNFTGNPTFVTQPAGTSNTTPATTAFASALGPVGQCYFSRTNNSTCTLNRHDGQWLTINGVPQSIPSAGITLSNTGLTASTIYYAYAFMNSGVMTGEWSATVPIADTATGVQIKTGDPTRTLVGCAYTDTNTPGQFTVGLTTLSYFNRKPLTVVASGSITSPPAGVQTLVNGSGITAMRWPDEQVSQHIAGTMTFNGSAGSSSISMYNSVRGVAGGALVNADSIPQGFTSTGVNFSNGFAASTEWVGSNTVSAYYISTNMSVAATIQAGTTNVVRTTG